MRLGPTMYLIVLRVRERLTLEVDDTHDHPGLVQILHEQRKLLIRITPPAHDFRCLKPAAQQREILRHRRAE